MKSAFFIIILHAVILRLSLSSAESKQPVMKAAWSSAPGTALEKSNTTPAGNSDANETGGGLSVKQWTGKKFIILPKQKIVQSFGYGLYCTPQLDKCKSRPNSDLATKEHRIRCDKFARRIVIAREVKPSGKEYLVRFIHEPTKISLFGKTHNGAIEGLALLDDLQKAQRRWSGATVYSLRRFINVYDSVTGNVYTRKVKIRDPLRVVEIRWGTTPLPPQPIWLMVETLYGMRGFIPVCRSWTNVMFDKIKDGPPWEEDIMEQDPGKLYSWDNVVWEAIDNHSVISGMTRLQVIMTWGKPKFIFKDTLGGGDIERWRFDNEQELRFSRDSLVSIGGQ